MEQRALEQPAYEVSSYAKLAEAESTHFWFRNRNRLIAWALGRYFPGAGSFLEIGCGTGFVLSGLRQAYPEIELHGAELHEDGLAFARRRLPDVDLQQLDAREMPFENSFDVVGAFDVLEHIPEDERALAGMRRAVRPGGGVLVTVPQHPWLWSRADDYGRHQRRYRRGELVEKLERAGFEVERVTSFVSVLLPLMMLSRFAERWRKADFDPMGEFHLNPLLNRSLEGLLGAEMALIKVGVSLPAGGSLLAVARPA